MKKALFGLFVLSLLLCGTSPGWAAGLTLAIHDGTVSLDAQDVTVRQILTEWARVGKTRIVNLERVTSGPITMRFEGVPEQQALDLILRNVPGYMAAPRAVLVADASVYDRILIMATTTAVAARTPATPAFQGPSPNVTQLRPGPMGMNPGMLPDPNNDQNDDPNNDPAIAAAAAAGLITVQAPPAGATGFNRPGPIRAPAGPLQPQPQAQPQSPAPASTTPSNIWNVPVGASRPGLAPPPPPAPTTAPVNRPRPPQPADQ